MIKKIIPYVVLLAAILQVVAAATISIDAFTSDTYNGLLTYIQPAPFVFAIWGVIYTLSFVYAIYQVVPKNNSLFLEYSRPYVLYGFLASGVWLYFAGLSMMWRWLTVPILVSMAYAFFKAVTHSSSEQLSDWAKICSWSALLPYAAWTAIAQVVNLHSILNQYMLIPNQQVNLWIGIILLLIIAGITLRTLSYVRYSLWYAAVLLWASFGVAYANITNQAGSDSIAALAGFLFVIVLMQVIRFGVILKK